MDILLFVIGFLLMFVGVLGSFLPVIPGPPLSWLGLLCLYFTKAVPDNWWLLGITLAIAIIVVIMDYIIPAAGTKRFGGSKYGIWGTTIGLILALVFPIFGVFGIIIWPFIGAFVGEMINKVEHKQALKAAFGSFLGFLTGTFLKFVIAVVYFGIFISKAWTFRGEIFQF
ncbi:DUF456 domain-containing protein [Robertkochia solimangrovi]|uniref:DUF456 domain-containing protein n=1 Tax=Robertkochia solimangrovi TaxID=2213046 RepID=UPI00117C33D1|nr:DUF456 domain-containing protein [Robertkochia solimangrovi]TRZ46351.1 DUF456 domain-containing protein [Robertkochia solimangrovi]